MKDVIDRIPAEGKANRKLITPEGGGAPFFATVVHADDPAEIGTPINRALFNDLQGFSDKATVFNPDGSITETSGDVIVTTVFNPDGSITETRVSPKSTVTKTTVFNPDGSISEVIS